MNDAAFSSIFFSLFVTLTSNSLEILKAPLVDILSSQRTTSIFRFFDIIKPFPVSYFDKKHKNSFGVIMDDVCAGLYVVLSLICFMVLKSLI